MKNRIKNGVLITERYDEYRQGDKVATYAVLGDKEQERHPEGDDDWAGSYAIFRRKKRNIKYRYGVIVGFKLMTLEWRVELAYHGESYCSKVMSKDWFLVVSFWPTQKPVCVAPEDCAYPFDSDFKQVCSSVDNSEYMSKMGKADYENYPGNYPRDSKGRFI